MRTLILMRHAKSDWKQPGLSDHDRPLNARGLRAAPAMARHLREAGLSVDVILASTAQRVRQTVELLQSEWAQDAEVLFSSSLYLASPAQLIAEIQSLHDSWKAALVVAHNPGIVALVDALAVEELEMPTAAAAIFDVDTESWNVPLSAKICRLRVYRKPRDLMANNVKD